MSSNNKTVDIENLLEPRYEVIALYPECPKQIGAILYPEDKWECEYYDRYPHLFKRVPWYKYLDTAELPQHVKLRDDYTPTKREKVEKGAVIKVLEWHCMSGTTFFIIKPYKELSKADWYNPSVYEPATLSQYEAYINSQKK